MDETKDNNWLFGKRPYSQWQRIFVMKTSVNFNVDEIVTPHPEEEEITADEAADRFTQLQLEYDEETNWANLVQIDTLANDVAYRRLAKVKEEFLEERKHNELALIASLSEKTRARMKK